MKTSSPITRVHSRRAKSFLAFSLELRLAEIVEAILKHAAPAKTAGNKYAPYLSGISLGALKELRRGSPIERKLIVKFANASKIKALDRKELFIRWGEALLGTTVYQDETDRVHRWINSFDGGDPKAMSRIVPQITRKSPSLAKFVRGWSIQNSGHKRGLEIRAIAKRLSLSESGLQKALTSGCMKRDSFLQLQATLRLPEQSRRNLAQYYLEAQVGEQLVLSDPKVFESHFDKHTHSRYIEWVLLG